MTAKTPLVLVPGLLCDEDLWADQARGLADLAEIEVTRAQTRHDSLPAIAAEILAAAPPRFALAGLSMGGYVAFEIVRQAPARVTRLALLDTSARPDTPEQTARRRGLIELAQKGRFKGVTPKLLPLLVHPDRLEDKPLVARILAMAEHVGRDGFLSQQRAIIARPDSRPLLKSIRVPTMVLCGRQDQITPLAMSEEMAVAVADASLRVIEHCGHLSTMERPEQVTRALRHWLAQSA
jgi:pimeloyl-ACP methyl ester carboxylesterase